MRNRRFVLLAATLVALNISLWVVPQGLALQRVVVASLFGKNLVRAQVKETSGITWHVDRGIVVSNSAGVLTLREADTTIQPISVSPAATKVTGAGGTTYKLKAVKPGWRVLVTWPDPNGPADSVVVEKKHA